MQKTGLKPDEIIFVGDNPIDDIDGALISGITPIQIIQGDPEPIYDYGSKEGTKPIGTRPGVEIIHSLKELLELLL